VWLGAESDRVYSSASLRRLQTSAISLGKHSIPCPVLEPVALVPLGSYYCRLLRRRKFDGTSIAALDVDVFYRSSADSRTLPIPMKFAVGIRHNPYRSDIGGRHSEIVGHESMVGAPPPTFNGQPRRSSADLNVDVVRVQLSPNCTNCDVIKTSAALSNLFRLQRRCGPWIISEKF